MSMQFENVKYLENLKSFDYKATSDIVLSGTADNWEGYSAQKYY